MCWGLGRFLNSYTSTSINCFVFQQLMSGLVLGTIVFFADLYFLVKEDMRWHKREVIQFIQCNQMKLNGAKPIRMPWTIDRVKPQGRQWIVENFGARIKTYYLFIYWNNKQRLNIWLICCFLYNLNEYP